MPANALVKTSLYVLTLSRWSLPLKVAIIHARLRMGASFEAGSKRKQASNITYTVRNH